MPSRKTGSSDVQSDSRRTSLRRLSSIASFQSLFNRRRSNNATDPTANSSTSNLSVSSSTIANAPEPAIQSAVSTTSLHHQDDSIAELPRPPIQQNAATRRSSYICLPDDPIGGMPRSRTFSNLPLPTRPKNSAALASSKSHARLPSAYRPSTRLPSPPTTNRKHSHTRLTSVGTNIPSARNRMKRSDTEPLIPVNVDQINNLPRSTAFKENISLSPIKPLPAMDISGYDGHFSSSQPSGSYVSAREWQQYHASSDFSSSAFYSSSPPYANHPAVRIAREHKSSPAYRSARDRPPTPGGSNGMDIQRWNSQPVLTNSTNVMRHGSSQRPQIKQTRLMSARQAPTPPPPKTPVSSQALASGRVKSINNSGPLRETSERAPTKPRSSSKKVPSPKKSSLLYISAAEPPAYWLGRVSALADRYRNEELQRYFSRPSMAKSPPKSETDKMHTPEAAAARLCKAFDYLHELCLTQEARESLAVFQLQYATLTGCEGLSKPIQLNAPMRTGKAGADEADSGEAGGMSEGRKASFMDRLLGRPKRRSLVLA